LVGAAPALIPFFLLNTPAQALIISALSVFSFLFILGIAKTKITKGNWFKSGIETLFIGALSCGSGFFLGYLIARYFH
jgi:VIT1/CCC1 family predicted Fe2+/Mn2+ transporter